MRTNGMTLGAWFAALAVGIAWAGITVQITDLSTPEWVLDHVYNGVNNILAVGAAALVCRWGLPQASAARYAVAVLTVPVVLFGAGTWLRVVRFDLGAVVFLTDAIETLVVCGATALLLWLVPNSRQRFSR